MDIESLREYVLQKPSVTQLRIDWNKVHSLLIAKLATFNTLEQWLVKHNSVSEEDFKKELHRSYIIPLDKIGVLDENTVLIGDKTIPIGKSYKDVFMSRLNFL